MDELSTTDLLSPTIAMKIPQWVAPAVEVLLGIYSVESYAQSDPRVREHNTVD